MPAFDGLAHYQPALVLLLGVLTFLGTLGVGSATLRALRLRIPAPWRVVTAALLGAAMLSLGVQGLAMLARATPSALVWLWAAFAVLGSIEVVRSVRGISWQLPSPRGSAVLFLLGLLAVPASIDLLLAMAPSTKIDEIYYQMLPAARIVLDGGLRFYVRPWEASIVPQMGYAIAAAPLHAMGYADAPNVWSWCLSMLLSWFVARLVHEETGSVITALLAAASVQIGLYPSVFHTTGGPHALGDLAMAAGVLALAFRTTLLRSCTPASYVALLSICTLMGAFTKISLLPVAGTVLLVGLAQTLRTAPGRGLQLLIAAALPWLVLYLPLCVWTFLHSGSPFGPILAGAFGPSVFGDAVHEEMAGARLVNQGGLLSAARNYALHYPLIYPVTVLALLLLPDADRARRRVVAFFLLAQVAIVAILLPYQSRFLSGLHHAALVVGLIQLHPLARRWLAWRMAPVALASVLLVPWLGVQVYRAWPLAPIALGIGNHQDYYRDFIALYDDFRRLDRILPEDAVLYARNRLPSIYFPRPVYMDYQDLPAGRPTYVLLGTAKRPMGEESDCGYLRLASDCRLMDLVYTNPEARSIVFRTPGHEAETVRLEVRRLLPGPMDRRASPFQDSR